MTHEPETSTGPVASPPASSPPASPVAPGTPAGLDPHAAPAVSAVASVPLFGGQRGGRPRKDGLKPGSPEAIAADKLRDAERKRLSRARASGEPPPLPAAGVADPAAPPAAGGDVLRDGGELPLAAPQAPDWAPEDVQPAVVQLVSLGEDIAVRQIGDRARSANLDGALLAEIEKDAAWNPSAKKNLVQGGSPLAAGALNKLHVPKAAAPFLTYVPGLTMIVSNHLRLLKRLDALIEAAHKTTEKKP